MGDLKHLWAKKSREGEPEAWLPLSIHSEDCAYIAARLWDCWLPESVKRRIIKDIGCEYDARSLFVFLAYLHDVGKASDGFQNRDKVAVSVRHEILSHVILERAGFDHSVCVILGGHHGTPPSSSQIVEQSHVKLNDTYTRLIDRAATDSELNVEIAKTYVLSRAVQVILTGLVIMCDWIASNTDFMPLIECDEYEIDDMFSRVNRAWQSLNLPEQWQPDLIEKDFYDIRFEINNPYPMQTALLDVAQNTTTPGIYVVEAPMGEGKTEAALVMAETLAHKFGLRGVYFALPSQATSNAMFERVASWLDKFDTNLSIALRHSKADLNLSQSTIFAEHDGLVVHEWLAGRKKGMLADFCVGTIDHVLMAGLKQKHLVLRHLGLSNKIVIIDEVHAYDVYMESYLFKALNWLGALGVPVIILSATLPTARRVGVISAYQNKRTTQLNDNHDYPCITYTENNDIKTITPKPSSRKTEVNIINLQNELLLQTLEKELANGGYVGIIANTVKEAQRLYSELKSHFDCTLLHAGFIYADRKQKEDALIAELGKSNLDVRTTKRVIIGTQIFEQSMDIDFDVLFTQLCPIDLLLQRIGRLHRHNRPRPNILNVAKCYVLPPDEGANAVYGEYLLERTQKTITSKIALPKDIPSLVAAVYDNEDAEDEWVKFQHERAQKAKVFQIGDPREDGSLLNWLSRKQKDVTERQAEATVRDAADSVEVLVAQRRKDELYLIQDGESIPHGIPNDELAIKIALSSIRLPSYFGKIWMVDKVIKELETGMVHAGIGGTWYKQPLLNGHLVLILDENLKASLCGYEIQYNREIGISYSKEESDGKSI